MFFLIRKVHGIGMEYVLFKTGKINNAYMRYVFSKKLKICNICTKNNTLIFNN